MIQRVSHGTIFVLDQDRAKAFYTEKLGFDVCFDVSMQGFRWLTVAPKGQPDFQLVLTALRPSHNMDQAAVDTLKGLVERGVFGAGVLATSDCVKTYEELRAKGVEFLQAPTERPYGIEALLKDDSGNWFSLTQRR